MIKELLGHAHIGVTAGVYAHLRLRLQRQAIDALSTSPDGRASSHATRGEGDEYQPEPPSSAGVAVNYRRHPHAEAPPGHTLTGPHSAGAIDRGGDRSGPLLAVSLDGCGQPDDVLQRHGGDGRRCGAAELLAQEVESLSHFPSR